jgi:hypothetical protein
MAFRTLFTFQNENKAANKAGARSYGLLMEQGTTRDWFHDSGAIGVE